MKLKTLMSAALAIVGSAAVAAVSQPAAWFDEAVKSELSSEWSAGTYVAETNETPAHVLIEAEETAVTFTPTAASASTGKVRETINFAVASVDALDTDVLADTSVQTSFCVYDGNYYAAVKTNDVPAWVNLGTAAEDDSWVTIALEFDYSVAEAPTVAFYTVANETETQLSATIDEETVTAFAPLNVKTCVTSTGFKGYGQVASLAGVQQGFFGVGDDYYVTFAEAKTAAAGTETITLYTDVAGELNVGDKVTIALNGHNFTPSVADGVAIVLTETADGGTYEAKEGLAKLNDKWYTTFDEAYAQASADTDTMVIKIDGNFSKSFDSSHSFESVTFTNTSLSADNITISTLPQVGGATFMAKNWIFPTNATLALCGEYNDDSILLFSAVGGTLDIPEGTVVSLNGYQSLNGVSAITGGGVLVAPPNPNSFINNSGVRTARLLACEGWTGTFKVSGTQTTVWNLGDFGNDNSRICFNGLTTYLKNETHSVGTIELVGDGLTINGNYANGIWTFPGALTGSGALDVQITDSASGNTLKKVVFSGDVSAFAGSVSIATNANCNVAFGTATTSSKAKEIIVATGTSVTVAEGKVWKASDFIVNGNMTIDGALVDLDDATGATPGVVWNNVASSVLTVNAANAFTFGSTANWVGRYVVNFTNTANDVVFTMPLNAGATIEINGVDGVFGGYPRDGSGAPTVNGAVVLNADWTVGDGWDNKTTTFATLSGSGDLIVNGKDVTSTKKIPYVITTLDGYTGTLGGVRGGYTIGKVNVAELPADGTRVVKTDIGSAGSINDNVPLYVNNEDTGRTLTYDADGADGAGLYLVGGSTPGVEPGASDGKTYNTAEAATNAAQSVTVAVPAAVTNVLTDAAAQTTYKGMFEGKVVDNGDGTYGVMVDLKVGATSDIQADVDAAETTVGGQLSTIADSTTATEVGITDAAPGIYYGVGVADTVDGTYTVTTWTMAGASGAANLSVPAANGAAKKFYKVMATAKVTE